MRKTVSNPVFLVCLSLAFINQIIEKGFGIFIPIVHSYLDDLLCFPIVLTLGLAAYRAVIPNYRLGMVHMLSVLIVYSVYFEGYLPLVSDSTRDWMDLVMYLLGTVVFGYFINKPFSLSLTNSKEATT